MAFIDELKHEHETRTPAEFSTWLTARTPRVIEVNKQDNGDLVCFFDNGSQRTVRPGVGFVEAAASP